MVMEQAHGRGFHPAYGMCDSWFQHRKPQGSERLRLELADPGHSRSPSQL